MQLAPGTPQQSENRQELIGQLSFCFPVSGQIPGSGDIAYKEALAAGAVVYKGELNGVERVFTGAVVYKGAVTAGGAGVVVYKGGAVKEL
jgi:hypothetical protein